MKSGIKVRFSLTIPAGNDKLYSSVAELIEMHRIICIEQIGNEKREIIKVTI